MINGGTDEVLFKIHSEFECIAISDKDETNYDATISEALDKLNSVSNDIVDEKKLIVMSFCESDDSNICGIHLNEYPGIDVLVRTANKITSRQDQFSCSLFGGTSCSENYRGYDSILQSTSRSQGELKQEICEKPTPSPTDKPVQIPTSRPTLREQKHDLS